MGRSLLAALRAAGLKSTNTGLSVMAVMVCGRKAQRETGSRRRQRTHRALQLEVRVLQLRAGRVPANHVELGEDLLVWSGGRAASQGGNLGCPTPARKRTLFLLLGQ